MKIETETRNVPRVYLQCRRNGELVWTSRTLPPGLEPHGNLLDLIDGKYKAEAARFLQSPSDTIEFSFKAHPETKVRFWPLSVTVTSLLLMGVSSNGSIQERSDPPRIFAEVEGAVARSYFRLLLASSRLAPQSGQFKPKLSEVLIWEQERSRIALDLHAGAGQPLAGIKISLELIRNARFNLPPEVARSLDNLQLLADQALEQIRAVSHRLHPPYWQTVPLAEALRGLWLSSGVEDRFVARLRMDIHMEPAHSIKVILYRCFQECLSNILRHSAASDVSFYVGEQFGMLQLQVADNGVGFDANSKQNLDVSPYPRGIGLASMREQVASVGGKLEIESSSQGTKLRILLHI